MESTEWVINFGWDTSLQLLDNCMHAKSCLILCDPMDCSPPGSSVHGIAQARILEWVSMPSSEGSALSLMSSALTGGFFTTSATWEAPLDNYYILNHK